MYKMFKFLFLLYIDLVYRTKIVTIFNFCFHYFHNGNKNYFRYGRHSRFKLLPQFRQEFLSNILKNIAKDCKKIEIYIYFRFFH